LLAVYRLGGHIPTPGINITRWEEFFSSNSGSIFGFFDLFAGGNIRRLTVFALGIMPYITASIILQLLTVVVPTLEKLQKEGELGRRKITQWTRYLTIILSVLQSFGIAQGLQAMQQGIVINPGIGFVFLTIISLTTGTAFIMWLGEQISERGIGNGMSLIIFTGIVVGLPNAIANIYQHVFTIHDWGAITLIMLIAMMIAVVAFIVLVERGERRIPVQYAKRVVGRRVMGGQSTHMPLKVNAGGVIPVIFASSILAFPQTLAQMPWVKNIGLAGGHAEEHPARRTALLLPVRGRHHLLLFLLRFHHFQSQRGGRQHAQVRRLHSGHPPRPQYGRLHEQHPHQDHGGGRYLPVDPVPDSGHHDLRDQVEPPAVAGQLDRPRFAPVHSGRLGRELLFWRHIPVDCRRRGHGYDQPDRSTAHHAAL
jgi:preprotein translocase subunit SecY